MAQVSDWSTVSRVLHAQEPIRGQVSPHPVDAVSPVAMEHARPIETARDQRTVVQVTLPVMEAVLVSLLAMPDLVQVKMRLHDE